MNELAFYVGNSDSYEWDLWTFLVNLESGLAFESCIRTVRYKVK